jgi:hypothetical protein
MDGVRISYAPRSDASSAAELDALANAYAYLIKAHETEKAAEPASEPDGRDNAAIVTEKERGGSVERNKEKKERGYQGATKGR